MKQRPTVPDTKLVLAPINLYHDAQSLNEIIFPNRCKALRHTLVVQHNKESLGLQKSIWRCSWELAQKKINWKYATCFSRENVQVAQITQHVSAVPPWTGEMIIVKRKTSCSLLFCSFFFPCFSLLFAALYFWPHSLLPSATEALALLDSCKLT